MRKRKLPQIINDPQQLVLLKMQLAATVDSMEPFVKAICNLEGDGPYQELRTVEASIASAYYLDVNALAYVFAGNNVPLKQQWTDYADQCIQQAYRYYHSKFINGSLQLTVLIIKACHLFDPAKVHEMQPDAASIEELHCIPFLDDDPVIQARHQEFPNYLALSEDTADELDILQWWERYSEELPRFPM